MSYRNTLQADALKLVAKKMQSSLAVEGELPEDGLAAYGDDGDDMMMALARKIVSGEEDEAETVEEVFAQAKDAEAASMTMWIENLTLDHYRSLEVSVVRSISGAGDGWKVVWSRRQSRSMATVTTQVTSGRRSNWCWTTATAATRTDTQPSRSTGTATMKRP